MNKIGILKQVSKFDGILFSDEEKWYNGDNNYKKSDAFKNLDLKGLKGKQVDVQFNDKGFYTSITCLEPKQQSPVTNGATEEVKKIGLPNGKQALHIDDKIRLGQAANLIYSKMQPDLDKADHVNLFKSETKKMFNILKEIESEM